MGLAWCGCPRGTAGWPVGWALWSSARQCLGLPPQLKTPSQTKSFGVAGSPWDAFGCLWLQLWSFWALFIVVPLTCCVTSQKVLTYVKGMFQAASVPWLPCGVHGAAGCVVAGVVLSSEYLHHRSDCPYREHALPVSNRNCLDQVYIHN